MRFFSFFHLFSRRAHVHEAFSPMSQGGVKLIAHRGLCTHAPENSLAAFVAAGEADFYGIETDVHRTRDGQFVTLHDDSTGRVADRDLSVKRSALKELRSLTLRMPDGTASDTFRIPTLKEYLAVCKKYRKAAVIELKYGLSKEDIHDLVAEIKRAGYLKETVFISFTFSYLTTLRELLPDQPLLHLTAEASEKELHTLTAHRIGIDLSHHALSCEAAQKLRAAHIPIGVFTVNDPETAQRMITLGAEYLTCDRPIAVPHNPAGP